MAVCLVAALASSSAFGQTIRTWSGTTSNAWATTTNWSDGTAAGATSGTTSTDYALFNTNPTYRAPTWTTYLNLAGFTSGSGAGAFTIGTTSGSSAFLTSGGTTSISVGGTAGLTINAPLVILNASGSSSGSYTFLNSTTTNNTALVLGGAISGQATTGNTTAITFTANRPANSSNMDRITGAISDGTAGGRLSLTKSGSSILLLTGSNSYTGGTTITDAGSILTFGGSTSLPATGTVTVGAGSTIGLRVGSTAGLFTATDIGNLFAGTMTNVSNNAASNVGIDTNGGDFTYSSSIAGTRGLVKLGTNRLALSASNSFSGGAQILHGGVLLGNAAALGSGTVTLFAQIGASTALTGANKVMNPLAVVGSQSNQAQTSFDATNDIEFGGPLTWAPGNTVFFSNGGTITFSGSVTLNTSSGWGSNGAANVTISGPISGAQTLAWGNNATMTLSGSNSFTGSLNVAGSSTASAVSFANANAVNSASSIRFGLGRLLYTGTGDTVTKGLTLGGNSTTTGTATLDQSGTGLLIYSGALSTGGTAGMAGKFILQGSTSGTGQINNSLPSNANVTVSLDKQGTGTWILLASNTYTGATTINDGTLQFGNGGTTGSLLTTSAISGSAGGTLAFNRSNAVAQGTDFGHAISGGLGFAQLGSGSLTLSGSNTFTGPTTAGAGVLRFDALAAGAGMQSLGGGTVVNLGVTGTTAGELQYFGSGGTLDKNVFALGTGRNRIRNSGAGTLGLSGTLTKNGTILELAGGTFNVTGQITGSNSNSDLFINGASVTLTNTNNDYNGPTYVYGGGTLTLGASGVIPNGSALTLGGTGGDTGSGSIVTGTFTDTVASLTTSSLGGTVGITINGATGGGLTTTGNLTFGAGTDTLNLSLTGLTLGKYSLLTYQGTRSGTFDAVNITNPDSRYTLVYGGASNSAIDLQMKADQANTFTLTPAASRVLVGGSTTLSGVLANSSPTGAAALAWSPTVTGSLTGVSSSLGASIAAGGTSTITATFLAGNTATSQAWSLVNTDNNAITTTSTASGSISVVNQRTFSVSNSGTINLGNFLRTSAVTGSATVSSTGLNATTANATLGAFSGTNTNGFSLATVDSTVFNGGSPTQSALYTLSGSAASAGAITGSFSSPVTAELGSIAPVAVALVGTAYDPARASFTSGVATPTLLVDIGEFNQNTGDHTYGFSIYNLLTDPTYTADLTLVSITDLITQSNSLSINLTPGSFGNLPAGGMSSWLATLTSGSTGSFTNQYQLNFVSSKASQSLGGPQSMTLTVTGVIIVPEPGAIALAGIGIATVAWALRRRRR